MSKKFQRKIEDFVCENCGYFVKGNGYTNHCPQCLWSKHVDNNPGDRENGCGGMMEPIDAYYSSQQWTIVQKCKKCGTIKKVKALESDNLETIKNIIINKQKNE